MTISGGEVIWEKNLIEYYDALEFFLGGIRLSERGVFHTRFSLLYFIESAFHNPDKDLLCRRMSELLVPGGDVYIIELFLTPGSERLLARSEGKPRMVLRRVPG